MYSTSKNGRGAINYRQRFGVGLVNVLVGVAVAAVLLVALLSSLATYVRSTRSLRLRTKAEELLFSRAESLASMPLTSVPADGVYPEGKLREPLADLVKTEDTIQFRLEVVGADQLYPNYFFPNGPKRRFSDFVRLRLFASWQSSSSDVVLFRTLLPVQAVEKESGQ